MRIRLKKEIRSNYETVEVEKGTTIEELYNRYRKELPYTVLAAEVNNQTKMLNYKLEDECSVELMDMRYQAANVIYQNGLCLIFLKAMKEIFGDVPVRINNSLNKGLFITCDAEITEEKLAQVSALMQGTIDADEKITREKIYEDGRKTQYFHLGDYRDYFSFDYMVPSTGYIEYFELMPYRTGMLLRFPHSSKPDTIPPYVDEVVLWGTFEEQERWGQITGVRNADDLNECIQEGRFTELVQLSEALHGRRIVELAQEITEKKKRIILIAGPSSSGKTTFAKRLCIQLQVNGLKPLYMGTDDYFVEREDTPLDEFGEKDYENLNAVDLELFNKNMNDLLAGKTVDLPTFNFMTGTKEFGKRIMSISEDQPIVIEGIHALNDAMTSEIPAEEKFKIYISPLTSLNIDDHNRVYTTEHRMIRRMVRDYQYRGRSAIDTLHGWAKVRAGEDKNIFPYSNEADAMFNSCHIYEITVLKKYALPLLEAITPEADEYGDARRLISFLKCFETAPDDSCVPNNSIIREFIGGSIFG